MSVFWDAVGRAALGLSGTAAPRPRSLFEPDGPGPFMEDAQEIDEKTYVAEPPVPAGAQPQSFATLPATAISERAAEQPKASVPPERAKAEYSADPSRAQPHAQEPLAPEPNSEPVRKPANHYLLHEVERLEIERIETTHKVTESVTVKDAEAPPGPVSKDVPSMAVHSAPELSIPAKVPDEPGAAVPVVLAAAPVAVELPSVTRAPNAHEAPLVIEIDRIDIRIEAHSAAPAPAARRREYDTSPSLDDYLTRRSEARR